tara:strand:- start:141 stop:416 length:276 start_codon:yes stop_codon:yes gene_type:complete
MGLPQNITLHIGKGYTISLAQDCGGSGNTKGHYVEVALLKDGSFVNTCYWYHNDVIYDADMEDYYDQVVTHVNGQELENILAKANLYVKDH